MGIFSIAWGNDWFDLDGSGSGPNSKTADSGGNAAPEFTAPFDLEIQTAAVWIDNVNGKEICNLGLNNGGAMRTLEILDAWRPGSPNHVPSTYVKGMCIPKGAKIIASVGGMTPGKIAALSVLAKKV